MYGLLIISFQCAIHPGVRPVAKITVNISTGMPMAFKVGFKPTSTINLAQQSVRKDLTEIDFELAKVFKQYGLEQLGRLGVGIDPGQLARRVGQKLA